MTIPIKVVEHYVNHHGVKFEKAKNVFCELEKYLQRKDSNAESPTIEVDDAWHTFILHTKDYMKYCNDTFGRYIHHTPFDNSSLSTNATHRPCG